MELEMRIVKKVAAAAMAMAVVFGAASLKPVAANAAQAGPETASVMEEENSFLSHQDEVYQNEFNWVIAATIVLLRSARRNWPLLILTFVLMASAILPSSQRMASKMCRLARTTWRAFPPPMQR